MKKYMASFVAISLCFFLSACSTAQEKYDEGYANGYADATADLEYLLEEEFDKGYETGYEQGESDNEDNYDKGYSEGENDGYYSGATYTCLFFGDVDRAFKCAKNGATLYTFIEAYDEFISNIYDDDETKSSIHWALVSVLYGDNASKQEQELLINTFGEELFAKNGVSLSP